MARKIFLIVARAVTARNVQKMEILSPQTTCGKFGCKKFDISLFKESGWGGGGGSWAPQDPPPSYVPAGVRENEYVLHFIDEQGLFSMGILRETLNSASRTLQC